MSPADLQNFPLLDEAGAAMLRFLREQPNAPRYTHVGCDRLSAAGLERVRAYDAELQGAAPPADGYKPSARRPNCPASTGCRSLKACRSPAGAMARCRTG